MAFFVYVAILLVAISGILLELDWLTKPKLDTKSPLQTATAVLPAPEAAKPKIEKPKSEPAHEALNPVYPKTPDVAPVVESPPAQQRVETTGNAPPQPQQEPQPQQAQEQTQQPQQAQPLPHEPQQPEQAQHQQQPEQQQVQGPPQPQQQVPAVPQATPAVASSAAPTNTCNVQACAAA